MRTIETKGYPYAWLDEIIEVTLNPSKTNLSAIESQQLKFIENKFNSELGEVLKMLKANTFYVFSSKKVKAIVIQYYQALCFLQRQALANLEAYPSDHPIIYTGENLLQYLQDIESAFKLRYGIYLKDEITPPLENAGNENTPKLICRLSVDQLAIIFRAADDAKLIIASSISIIFRRIVPFLATEKKTKISWNSMRKSTYQIEQSDKDIAVAILEKLIDKIKHY
ncbi:hypothetical protein [Mucilaginibacter sp.]|uniref:hypothetical protein n=1 Tax=Mucilaginibacter sp. TaxID=1882438 RepID=UPI003D13D12C